MNWELTLSQLGAGIGFIVIALVIVRAFVRRAVGYRGSSRSRVHTETPVPTLTRLVHTLWSTIRGIQTDVAQHRLEIHRAAGGLVEQSDEPISRDTVLSALTLIADSNRRLENRLQAAEAQLKAQSKQLEEQWMEVRSDPLTGLANRRVFDMELSRRLREFRNQGVEFALALYDIDHFKQINDSGGHKTGDEILMHVAHAMQFEVPEDGLIARIGGEEFGVLLPYRGLDDILALAERIRVRPYEAFNGAPSMQISLSCGVAVARHGDTETTLFERADRALYAAKQSGRNATFFDWGNRTVRYAGPVAALANRSGIDAESCEEENTVAWHDDPEAQVLIGVLRKKLSDLQVLE